MENSFMKEYVGYSDLIQFGVDPLAPENWKEGTKFRIYQATGVYLHTINNLQIMDFTAGINGNNLGHNHPRVLSAAVNQMENNSYPNSSAVWDLGCFSLEHGLLPYFAGSRSQAICMMPPLNVTEDQVDSALCILGKGLERI